MKNILIICCIFLFILTGALSGCTQQHLSTNSVTTPTIVLFNATKTTINHGESTMLTWKVANATNVTLADHIGASPDERTPVALSGAQVVSPKHTTDYVLQAVNEGRPTAGFITITVVSQDRDRFYGTWIFRSGASFDTSMKFTLNTNGTGDISTGVYDTSTTYTILSFNLKDGEFNIHYEYPGTAGGRFIILDYEFQNDSALLLTEPGSTTSALYVKQ